MGPCVRRDDGTVFRPLRIPVMRKLPVVHISACAVGQITTMLPRVPYLIRGALRDRHERWERDAMDAACCRTNDMTRTAKSCGPGAPRLALSRADDISAA